MSANIPETYRDLLEKPIVVTLVTLMPDGMPQATPVWCDYDGTHVLVNVGEGRQKDKNMRARPQVAILAIDPEDSFRYLEVRGMVEEYTEDGAEESMTALSLLYTGKPKRYGQGAPPREVEARILFKIRPVRVTYN